MVPVSGNPLNRKGQIFTICVYCATLISSGFQALIEQIFEFIGNNFILVSIFVFLLVAFFVNEGKQGGAAITPSSLVSLVNREGAMIVDIRDSKEYGAGHIAGASNMPYVNFESRKGELESHKEKPIVLVCKMGQHSGAIGKKLRAEGYTDVRRLSGGMAEWNAASLPVVK